MKTEIILLRITGEDRPGLTASFMAIMAAYDVEVLDSAPPAAPGMDHPEFVRLASSSAPTRRPAVAS